MKIIQKLLKTKLYEFYKSGKVLHDTIMTNLWYTAFEYAETIRFVKNNEV